MSSSARERFIGAVRLRDNGCVCRLPLIFGYAAKLAGVAISDYVSDGEALAFAQLSAQRRFGYDAVFVYADSMVEAESLGAHLSMQRDDYPFVAQPYATTMLAALFARPVPEPAKSGRMPQLLQAARIMGREAGQRVPVVGCVSGPLSIACQLLGLENMLFLLADEPCLFEELLKYTCCLSRNLGLALLASGATVLMLLDPAASQNIITPGIFVELELPLLQSAFQVYKGAGAQACWLVITGQTLDLLPYYPQTKADLVTVDYEVPLEKALHLLPGLAVAGNIKPFNFVAGNREQMRESVRKLFELARLRPGYIPGSGCELPLNSQPEYLEILVQAN